MWPRLGLHWPGEICLLHPGDSLRPYPTQLAIARGNSGWLLGNQLNPVLSGGGSFASNQRASTCAPQETRSVVGNQHQL